MCEKVVIPLQYIYSSKDISTILLAYAQTNKCFPSPQLSKLHKARLTRLSFLFILVAMVIRMLTAGDVMRH